MTYEENVQNNVREKFDGTMMMIQDIVPGLFIHYLAFTFYMTVLYYYVIFYIELSYLQVTFE